MSTPIVYVIEDKKMPKHTMDLKKVPGLGLGTTADTNYGYLLFVEDRSLFPAFYTWWLKEVFVPFVNQIRDLYNDPVGTKVVLVEDGETIQIENLLMDPELRKFLHDNYIMICKSSASTTEIQQPLDRGNIFKAIKALLHALTNDNICNNPQYQYLKSRLKQYWEEHERTYHTNISADHKKAGINGLIKTHHCVRQHMTIKNITKSFESTGTFPYSDTVIMNECTADINIKMQYSIRRSIDYLKAKLEEQGELFEKDFQDCSIDDNIGKKGKPKDELIVCRRRCVILTNEQFYQRELKKKDDKRIATEEAAQRKIANQEFRVARAAAKEAKEIEKKRKKEYNDEVKRQKEEARRLKRTRIESS